MVVLQAKPQAERPLRDLLSGSGFVLEDRPHARFMARGPGATVTLYKSGKLLVTGKSDKDVAQRLLKVEGVQPLLANVTVAPGSGFFARVGTDEAGKGDYFGPLVVAAVVVDDPEVEKRLQAEGVRDSKTLTSATVARLDAIVRATCLHTVVTVEPEAYNRLHGEMRNLNVLLAWGHARALEDALAQKPVPRAVADQFGDKKHLEAALLERGRQVRLEQRPGAESDPAVAAASVVARAEFVRRLDALGQRWGMPLPKGAGPDVLQAARTFAKRHGKPALGKVAKLHFRTTLAV